MEIDAVRFLSIGAPRSKFGDNIAFAKVKETETLAFFDFGPSIGKKLTETHLLEDESITNVIAIGTHTHDDHINGAADLSTQCELRGKKLRFVMPDIKRQQDQLYAYLKKLLGKFETIEPDGAKELLDLKNLSFESMHHSNLSTSRNREQTDTTAIIMETKADEPQNKLIYAADNNDPVMIQSFLTDVGFAKLFLEITFIKHGMNRHQTLNKLENLAQKLNLNGEMKKRIVCMHYFNKALPQLVKEKGYSSAEDLLYIAKT